jgi:hypothetical protein
LLPASFRSGPLAGVSVLRRLTAAQRLCSMPHRDENGCFSAFDAAGRCEPPISCRSPPRQDYSVHCTMFSATGRLKWSPPPQFLHCDAQRR